MRRSNLFNFVFFISLLSNTSSQKGRKNKDLMEEIQRTVNLIYSSFENNQKINTDWSHKFSTIENHILVISNRVEKIVDSIENNKLNDKFVNEKLDKLESKINSIEESMTTKMNLINDKVEQIMTDMKNIDSITDAKLRKIMNIISDTYELSKDMTISMKGRQGSAIIGGDDNESNDRIDELQKKVLEQLSIVERVIVNHLAGISKLGKETLGSFDTINVEMLNLRDECHTQRTQEKSTKSYDHSYDDNYSSVNKEINAQSFQCPNVNISGIKQDINSKYDQMVAKIESQLIKFENKINEFSKTCNNNNNENARSIQNSPTIIADNSHIIEHLAQSGPNRRTINPADKPTGRSECQHSSELLAPKSCSELRKSGSDCDGVYIIRIAHVRLMRVYCDMNDNGGGWTVILRRGDFSKSKHAISFDQNWDDYKGGFGNIDSGEFWLGLDTIYALTNQEDNILQVDLESFDGDYVSITYDSFKIGTENDNYKLHIGKAMQSNVTIAESLIAHNTSMFTTRDRNNGRKDNNCASKLSGGWWFHNCHSALLTAPYYKQHGRQHLWQGMQWHSWKQWHHLKAAQMKIRSKLF